VRSAGISIVVAGLLVVCGCCSQMGELFDGSADVPAVDSAGVSSAAQAATTDGPTGGEDVAPGDSPDAGSATAPQGGSGAEDSGATGEATGEDTGEATAAGEGVETAEDEGSDPAEGTAGEGYVVSATDDSSSLFAKLDADGDGLIAATEFRGDADEFDQVDRNDDGYIDAEEASNSRPTGRGRPGDFIGRLDKDGDGRVSRDEFPGRQQRWDRMDSNGDGFIEASEAPSKE
jgi:hypothetical protein